MRSARATSASVATWTPPSGTGCSGSSGICRSTAAVHNRISWRAVGLSAARAGSPSAPTTSCSGVARSEYANPSVTTPYTTFPVSPFPFPVPRSPFPGSSTRPIAPIPMEVSLAVRPPADARGRPDCILVRPCLDPQQPEQHVVPLPGPEPLVPRVDLVPRPAPRAEHAGAVSRRDGERPLELRTGEVLRCVALDHGQGARVPREHGRFRKDAVHDEPFVGAEPLRTSFAELLLEGDARALDGATRRFESAAGLRDLVLGQIDELEPARFERRAHRQPERSHTGHDAVAPRFVRGAQAPVGAAAADGRRDVRPHDRQHAVVVDHLPELDPIEKADGERRRGALLHRVHGDARVLHRLGPGDLVDVRPAQARFGHVRHGYRPGRYHCVFPGARRGHGYRDLSAQPRYVTLRSGVSTLRPLPSSARATPVISCTTIPFRASAAVSSSGVMKRAKSWKPSGIVCWTYSSSQMSRRNAAMVRLCVRKPRPPPGART